MFFRANTHLVSACEGNWDSSDTLTADTCAVHYTRIETQCHLKHAIPRLKQEGRRHWYQGEVFPHPSEVVQATVDAYLAEATFNGFDVEHFRYKPRVGATVVH